jgi:hypothetical protein
MPTVLLVNGFRFFFYSNENNEPAHIHVSKGEAEGKIWIEPNVAVAFLDGFNTNEERFIIETVNSNSTKFKNKWHEYFGK